jgi:hypothetical protein
MLLPRGIFQENLCVVEDGAIGFEEHIFLHAYILFAKELPCNITGRDLFV